MPRIEKTNRSVPILTDSCGRKINYLRLSITDRCNFHCHYCMPAESGHNTQVIDSLSLEELETLAQIAVDLGIEKIRITGGEPLLRPGVVDFLARLGRLPGLRHLGLTTNGVFLSSVADELKNAGVHSINVSLDSLNPHTFASITRNRSLLKVLAGIDAAIDAKIKVKINTVPMRGINDSEIFELVDYACKRKISLRFIEYMPVYKPADWQKKIILGNELLAHISKQFDLIPLPRSPLSGPAQNFQISGTETNIGIISPVFGHICGDCNRIRITANARARGCLFSDQEINLRPLLKMTDKENLITAFKTVIESKPDKHQLLDPNFEHKAFNMSTIGG